jgi:2-oxoglutarate/2-oxoacid ferredoxin oxidoreductase subunit alpha
METNELNLGIVGSGGDGVMVAGEILVSAAARDGLNCIMLKSFGPQIRGGESACKIRISSGRVSVQADDLDILIAFNWKDYPRFGNELFLRPGGIVLEEGEEGEPEPERPIIGPQPGAIYRVPLSRLAKEGTGGRVSRNMVALGVVSGLFGLPEKEQIRSIGKLFEHKGPEVAGGNVKAFQLGREYALNRIPGTDHPRLKIGRRNEPRIVITGNDAVAYASLLAGCRFFSGYPITPSSEIMEWFGEQLPAFGGTMVQTEDEMAALGMVLGASLAGRKAMTATSGPGLSLMSEMIGLASIAEIPCVIVDVQRVGPSTGIPTKSEQSDLMQAVFGSHGDSPRVVMAPADVSDCFNVMGEAFYVSEKYQVPVIVLSDGFIGQCKVAVQRPNISRMRSVERARPDGTPPAEYKRFGFTASGVSPMSVPGLDTQVYRAAGIEHNELGDPTSDFNMHERMNEKRYRKLGLIAGETNFMRTYGPGEARVGIIAWGSSKGAVREAVEKLNGEGLKVKALIPQVLYPLAVDKLRPWLDSLDRLLVVELSYSRQFLNLLKFQTDLPAGTVHFGRSGARPLGVGEVVEQARKLF